MSEKKGIDVSYAQGNIDFSLIDKNKVNFAIVRSSYGWEKNQKDSKFDRNIKGFHSIGIPVGAYHYSYAKSTDDALKEAKYCLECIKGYEIELPIFYDLEENSIARLGKRTCTDIAKTFCDYIIKSGYKAGVYMNKNWFDNYVYKDELSGKYELWLAQWGVKEPAFDCAYWQYNVGSRGTMSGISGEIDLDISYVSLTSSNSPENINNTNTGTNENSNSSGSNSSNSNGFKKGDIVQVLDPVEYGTGKKFIVYPDKTYTVIEAVRDRIVIGFDGKVTAAVNAKYLRKVNTDTDNSEKNQTQPQTKTYKYKVQPGDNLTWIAKKFGTTIDRIVKENNIKNPNLIYSGEVLNITV